MPLVKITKDCKVSENGVSIIEFKEGDKVQVSDGLFAVIQKVDSGKLVEDKPAMKKTAKKKAKENKPWNEPKPIIEKESETIE